MPARPGNCGALGPLSFMLQDTIRSVRTSAVKLQASTGHRAVLLPSCNKPEAANVVRQVLRGGGPWTQLVQQSNPLGSRH